MFPRKGLFLSFVFLLLTSPACTIQGLPYPTAAPDSNLITPDLEATRELVEAGMFPTYTSAPELSATTEPTPAPAPTGRAFLIPSLTLKLAYIKEGDLWYWEDGQPPLQLTNLGDAYLVALADDASQVAYARELDYGSRELWVVNTDGSGARALVDSPAFQEMTFYEEELTAAPLQLDWLPGTNQVIFSTRIIYEGPGMVRKHELRGVDALSRTMTVLADDEYGGYFSISPDGTKIALALPDRISLVNADGSDLRELYSFPHIDTGSEWWYYPPLNWTLDSTAVRVIIPPERPMFDLDVPTRIMHLPVDGSSPRVLGEVLTIPVFYSEAMLSPDARQLAYVGPGASGEIGNGILVYASADGSGAAPYDEGQITLYTWLPDNRQIIYSINGINQIGNTAGEKIPLKVPGILLKVKFVDPSRFLFVSPKEGTQQLWLGELDGTEYLIAESSSGLEYDFVR